MMHFAESKPDVEMFKPEGQVGVALAFVGLMREGKYEEALALADSNWLLCRIQAQLWRHHRDGSISLEDLPAIVDDLHRNRAPQELWKGFVRAEAEQFVEAWRDADPATLGAASKRRRMSPEHDLVLLAPTGESGQGYYVPSATALPYTIAFLMRRTGGRWLVANDVGAAPPTPGLPPIWWTPADETFNGFAEAGAAPEPDSA